MQAAEIKQPGFNAFLAWVAWIASAAFASPASTAPPRGCLHKDGARGSARGARGKAHWAMLNTQCSMLNTQCSMLNAQWVMLNTQWGNEAWSDGAKPTAMGNGQGARGNGQWAWEIGPSQPGRRGQAASPHRPSKSRSNMAGVDGGSFACGSAEAGAREGVGKSHPTCVWGKVASAILPILQGLFCFACLRHIFVVPRDVSLWDLWDL